MLKSGKSDRTLQTISFPEIGVAPVRAVQGKDEHAIQDLLYVTTPQVTAIASHR